MLKGLGRKIIVVDDEAILASLIADRLRLNGFESWYAQDAFEAKKLAAANDVDAMIVDLDLGKGPTGMELVIAMSALNPNLGFVLFSNFSPTPWELKATEHLTYVRKNEVREFDVLLQALEGVLRDVNGRTSDFDSISSTELSSLTAKQMKILELISQGLSNPEVAVEMGVTTGAVEQAAKRIYAALGLEKSGKSRRILAVQMFVQTMGPRRTR